MVDKKKDIPYWNDAVDSAFDKLHIRCELQNYNLDKVVKEKDEKFFMYNKTTLRVKNCSPTLGTDKNPIDTDERFHGKEIELILIEPETELKYDDPSINSETKKIMVSAHIDRLQTKIQLESKNLTPNNEEIAKWQKEISDSNERIKTLEKIGEQEIKRKVFS